MKKNQGVVGGAVLGDVYGKGNDGVQINGDRCQPKIKKPSSFWAKRDPSRHVTPLSRLIIRWDRVETSLRFDVHDRASRRRETVPLPARVTYLLYGSEVPCCLYHEGD